MLYTLELLQPSVGMAAQRHANGLYSALLFQAASLLCPQRGAKKGA
ncbi:hypothetical protein [Kingella oralis]